MKIKSLFLTLILAFMLFLASCGKGLTFQYKVVDDNAILTHYSGGKTEITIEETYSDYKVTEIAQDVFYISALVKLNLSSNLVKINKQAFQSSPSLKEVTIPKNAMLKEIGDRVFSGCDVLESIELYNAKNLTTIGVKAFQNCPYLKEIYIPASVIEIQENAFLGCEDIVINLEATEIPSGFHESWAPESAKINLGKKYIKQEA